jgi:hypothetical protein
MVIGMYIISYSTVSPGGTVNLFRPVKNLLMILGYKYQGFLVVFTTGMLLVSELRTGAAKL